MPSSHDAPFDPCACPLCGSPNRCAMEAAKTTGDAAPACWCVSVQFSAALLAQVPPHAQRKACICENCARQTTPPPGAAHV